MIEISLDLHKLLLWFSRLQYIYITQFTTRISNVVNGYNIRVRIVSEIQLTPAFGFWVSETRSVVL